MIKGLILLYNVDVSFCTELSDRQTSAGTCIGEKTRIVSVIGDGRCFFRCIVVNLYHTLLSAHTAGLRSTHESRSLQEVRLADDLREAVVSLLSRNCDVLAEIAERMSFLLDDTYSKQYKSIEERIAAVSQPATFVGNLEILAVSYLLRTQIHVYKRVDCIFELVAKLPQHRFHEQRPVMLLYDEDKKTSLITSICY